VNTQPQRVAVVGAGVAGLTAAWLLQRRYRVDLYDANDYAGGHTRTVTIPDGPDAGTPIDTGFIVMNHRNYPMLTRIFDQLGVELGDSDMSFSYHCRRTGYAYAGTNLGTLFAQPRNLLNARHWGMLRDILRFNRVAAQALKAGSLNGETLGEYIHREKLGTAFAEHYLLAMGAAIWSAPSREIRDFPAEPFLHFFSNHGLLSVNQRPQWRYVSGGSRRYVERMLRDFRGTVNLRRPARSIRRDAAGVRIEFRDGSEARYDYAVVASHADESLALLADASPEERKLLGAWRYQRNHAVLHTDEDILPPVRRAWASWNFVREEGEHLERPVSVTYHMNRLQRLRTARNYLVTLNPGREIRPTAIVDETGFTHPMYSHASLATQSRLPSLNGVNRTYFCGSYFGYGFHEDAARSGVQAAEQLGVPL